MKNYYEGQVLTGAPEDYENVKWLYTTHVRGPSKRAKQLLQAPVQVEQVKHAIKLV